MENLQLYQAVEREGSAPLVLPSHAGLLSRVPAPLYVRRHHQAAGGGQGGGTSPLPTPTNIHLVPGDGVVKHKQKDL